MKTRILFFIISILLVGSCKKPPRDPKPQLTQVIGTVIDRNGSLENVSISYVYRDGTPGSAKPTDSKGNYRIESLKSGFCTFTFTKEGYENFQQEIEIFIDPQPAPLNVTMKELSGFLKANPDHLEFNTGEDQKTIFIENTQEQGTISFSISVTEAQADWLKINKTSGTVSNANAFQFTVSVDRTKVGGVGNYLGVILINGGGNNVKVPVNLNIVNPNAPSVSITKRSISQTSAEFLGTVLDEGGSRVIERGHVWSESENPTLESNLGISKKGAGGIGGFSSLISNLTPGKTYYIRAYATNANGTNYSEVVNFTTTVDASKPTIGVNNITEITGTSASVFGIATSDGGKPITEMGIVYGVGTTPTVTDNKKTVAINVGTEFKVPLMGLTPGVTYFVRAFATNSVGTEYSAAQSFTTTSNLASVILQTGGVTNLGENRGTASASLKLGGSPVVQHGFVWSNKNAEPTISNSLKIELGQKINDGVFTSEINNLTKGTLYYIRAYATTQNGNTEYGNIKEFLTSEPGLIVFYSMTDGSTVDMSSSGNNALNTSRIASDRNNNDSHALDLSYGPIIIQNQKYIGGYKGEYSISIWVKMNESNFNGEPKYLMSKYMGCRARSDEDGFYFYTDKESGRLNFYVTQNFGPKDKVPLMTKTEIGDNKWHLLTFTKSGKDLKFYLDGLLYTQFVATFDSTSEPYFSDASISSLVETNFRIGILGACNKTSNFTGAVDDFRIYNYSLTPSQVSDIFYR